MGAVKVAILAIMVYKTLKTALDLGVHHQYTKHYPGYCKQVQGLNFASEDLQVAANGLAFITSGVSLSSVPPGYLEFLKSNNIEGSIYLFDFNNPNLGARKLRLKPSPTFNPYTFHPHGISILEDKAKGEHLLYVINHPTDADDAIEKFRYLPKTNELVHLKSFVGDKLRITNDLAVVEEDKFYITNYFYFKNYYMSILEMIGLPFSLGSIVFFNGTDFTEMESGLSSPNGVSLSKDKKHLYVTVVHYLNVYEVNSDNTLNLIQSVAVNGHPDNLNLAQSGEVLYLGSHPIYYKVLLHLLDPNRLTPSSVFRLPLINGKINDAEITELFYDHGELISGSSVATVYNKKLLIGSILNKLVICDENSNS